MKLRGISLCDFMLRLEPSELNVCALKSSTAGGWKTKIAWSPKANFVLKANAHIIDSSGLQEFAKNEQDLGRLVVGYMSYDFGCALHGVKLNAEDDLETPLIYAVSFDSWLEFDSFGARIISKDPSYADMVNEIIARPVQTLPSEMYKDSLQPVQKREQYNEAYQKVQNYITAGDVYQINLAHRLEGTTTLSGRDLFCLLSDDSQSDFQSYIEDGASEILSFSPERFIKVEAGLITTQPIKGTRPRGNSKEEDKALEEDLLTNAKERAELDMITDLMRNDLGEVCRVGTVEVVERRTITSYPTLWHANSKIIGKLDTDMSPISALCHISPGGSITGCPKKRAIEIIDELEVKRRGIYTGSIFTIEPNGDLDSSIAIRTMLKKNEQAYLSVGGGIVHDSEESDEYQESLDKAASFLFDNSSLSSDI